MPRDQTRVVRAARGAPPPRRPRVVARDVADAEAAGAEVTLLQRQLDRLRHLLHRGVRGVFHREVGHHEPLRHPDAFVVERLAAAQNDGPAARSRSRGAREPRQGECGDDDGGGARHCRYTATHGPEMPSCSTVLKAAR